MIFRLNVQMFQRNITASIFVVTELVQVDYEVIWRKKYQCHGYPFK